MATKKNDKKVEAKAPEEAHDVEGLQQYEALLPLVEALDPKKVKVYRADMNVVLRNVRTGAKALLAEETRIAEELPKFNLANVRRAPDLALALKHATFRTIDARGAGTNIPEMIKENGELRAVMLASAESLALHGIFDKRKVEDIRKGRGAFDAADDTARLAVLFQTNADAARGKTPVTAAMVKRAAFLGSTLSAELKPTGAKRGPSKNVLTATDIRDRFGAILVADWELARRAAVYLFGLEQTEVPALNSVIWVKEKKPKEK
jgi:hypothetical protein